ncbi:MAG: hypothetical protein JO250_05420 [Armatimonadetes bacterium]|nr:hypothetical protein [Armatimonadota bacterium]
MMFDVEKLTDFAEAEIQRFATTHQDETFYAFCIDAQLLCLNSEEQLEKTLASHQHSPANGRNGEQAQDWRDNPARWAYQGFATFDQDNGFDDELYDDHLDMDEDQRKTSEYARAMDRVLELLAEREAFRFLKTSDDFRAIRVEHDY